MQLALGSLIIQTRYQFADKELVEQLTENPYYQYFIGFSRYQQKASFVSSRLGLFRKRITMDIIMEANEYMLFGKGKDDSQEPPDVGRPSGREVGEKRL